MARPSSDLTSLESHRNVVDIYRHKGQTSEISKFLSNSGADLVFHLASAVPARGKPINVDRAIDSNICFGIQLLEAMKENLIFRIVSTESYWQHFDNQAYSPVDLYAATKQAFRDLLKHYFLSYNFAVINLTLFDVYGPEDPRQKFFGDLRNAYYTGQPVLFSPGNQIVNLTYINDVVNAYAVAGDALLSRPSRWWKDYAVSCSDPLTLQEIVAKYLSITERHVEVRWGALPYRPRQIMVPWNKYPRLPEWQPIVTLEKGILEMEKLSFD